LQAPPENLIDARGRLTPELVTFLHENFGFSKPVLEATVYKQIRFHKSAITLYKWVFYDAKCLSKNELQWRLLIIHEQVHREEVTNNIFRAIAWYIGYLIGYMRAGFSYRKNAYEVRAYNFEAEAEKVLVRSKR
jgi:hypothetical protein